MAKLPGVLMVALLAGCHAPPSGLPTNEVLRFGVGHMGGSVDFVVKSDGTAEYRESGGPEGDVEVTGEVAPEAMSELAALHETNGFCTLVPAQSAGVPDEARPSAAVRLPGLDCRVQMWDGEFRDDAAAQAALRAIEQIGASIRKQRQ